MRQLAELPRDLPVSQKVTSSAPVFVFSGNGGHWHGMGRDLFESEAVFRAALQQCDEYFAPLSGWSLCKQLTGSGGAENGNARAFNVDVAQPLLVAVEIALAALWRDWGVEPAAVIGHSAGEISAACTGGSLSVREAMHVVHHMSRLQRRAEGHGAMIVVDRDREDCRQLIADFGDEVAIAAVNSARSTVLSGVIPAIQRCSAELQRQGVTCRAVAVNIAFHGPQMDEISGELRECLDGLRPLPSSVPLFSTVTGGRVSGEELGAEHWMRNVRRPVLFSSAIDELVAAGHDVFLEIGPHPLLSRPITEELTQLGQAGVVLSSMRRGTPGRAEMLRSLARLHEIGAPIRWSRVFTPDTELTPLPDALPLRPCTEITTDDDLPCLFVVSGHTAEALRERVAVTSEQLAGGAEGVTVRDMAHTSGEHRSQLRHRIAVTAVSRRQLRQTLDGFLDGRFAPSLAIGEARPDREDPIAFVFPGQGGHWPGMGRSLFREPAFRTAMTECDSAIRQFTGRSVIDELMGQQAEAASSRVDVVQPVVFSVQVALAALWRSWGVEPAAVVGHSMGEVAAAHVAGALDLRDAARVICLRSNLMARTSGQGVMAVAELSESEAEKEIRRYGDQVVVAAVNSPRSVVLSGAPGPLGELRESLEGQGRYCRLVPVDCASHSPQMDPLCAELRDGLSVMSPHPTAVSVYSTVTGARIEGTELDHYYWAQNLRRQVRFDSAVRDLLRDGITALIEVSPHPTLAPVLERTVRQAGSDVAVLTSLHRQEDERSAMLRTLGRLYVRGHRPHWPSVQPAGGRRVDLAPLPWQRERYWLAEPAVVRPASPLAAAPVQADVVRPAESTHTSVPVVQPNDLPLTRKTYFSLNPAARTAELKRYVCEVVAGAVGLVTARLDVDSPLSQLGISSLMLFDLRNRVRTDLGVTLPLGEAAFHTTVAQLSTEVQALLAASSEPVAAAVPPQAAHGTATDRTAPALLLCVPDLGEDAELVFGPWAEVAEDSFAVQPLAVPGRGARAAQAPIERAQALVDLLIDDITATVDGPFALFGHGSGALIAYEIARGLRRRALPEPTHLCVSAHRPPHLEDMNRPLHRLPDDQLVAELTNRGLVTEAMAGDPNFTVGHLPLMRADLAVVETYVHASSAPLDCTIVTFTATDDKAVAHDEIEQWRELTTGRFVIHEVRADHRSMVGRDADVPRLVAAELNNASTGTGDAGFALRTIGSTR
ncbi:acyltransferase domain-containing protein [Lentzea sp. NPDC051208]|uniref:acyltransferase domain-containing protein n=1 Tax=Lentzea sp. NPDC051208 TaxID=3154642 RepID=UPI0034293ED2